jgi:hypothetical protein
MPHKNIGERFQSSKVVGEEILFALEQPPAPVDYKEFARKLGEVITQAMQQKPARADARAQKQTRANPN